MSLFGRIVRKLVLNNMTKTQIFASEHLLISGTEKQRNR